MSLFERKEYDPQQGTWRTLAPGDPGRLHRWISRQDPYGPAPESLYRAEFIPLG
jgi:hypothetical protein